jgi:hypothetical protein
MVKGRAVRSEKRSEKGAGGSPSHFSFLAVHFESQAVKLLPHPQPPVELGLVNVNPEPCMEDV